MPAVGSKRTAAIMVISCRVCCVSVHVSDDIGAAAGRAPAPVQAIAKFEDCVYVTAIYQLLSSAVVPDALAFCPHGI